MPNEKVKFKAFTDSHFRWRYRRADDDPEKPDGICGEVEIPGHGWHACILKGGFPRWFFNDDDGWQDVPKALRRNEQAFERVFT